MTAVFLSTINTIFSGVNMNTHRVVVVLMMLLIYLFSGCAHLQTSGNVEVDKKKDWIVLPFNNPAETPRAAEQVESILYGMLQKNITGNTYMYLKNPEDDLTLYLSHEQQLQEAKKWAISKNIHYGISGSVQEFHYRSGLDGEPTVGITLNLIDFTNSHQTIWSATASRTGWGFQNLTGITSKVLATMFDNIRFLK
jgi:hypothetical protein